MSLNCEEWDNTPAYNSPSLFLSATGVTATGLRFLD